MKVLISLQLRGPLYVPFVQPCTKTEVLLNYYKHVSGHFREVSLSVLPQPSGDDGFKSDSSGQPSQDTECDLYFADGPDDPYAEMIDAAPESAPEAPGSIYAPLVANSYPNRGAGVTRAR